MRSSGKHRPKTRVRTVLVASGAAVTLLGAGTWAVASAATGGPAGSGGAGDSLNAAQIPSRPGPARGAPATPGGGETRSASPEPSPARGSATPKPKKPKKQKPKKQKAKKKKPKYRVLKSGSCEASYYWEGQMTASGERFDPSELTAAHKTLPMGSKVRVTNKNNDRSVIVRINDRGPYAGGRCLDLSKAAMTKVRGTGSGVIPVRYQVIERT